MNRSSNSLRFFILFFILILIPGFIRAQNTTIPSYYVKDKKLSADLKKITDSLGLGGNFDVGEDGIEQISLTVIDMNGRKPHIGGVNMDNFIYPASVYKMYVAAEVLDKISEGKTGLQSQYIVHFPNDVDKTKEIAFDPRPLLHDGDTVTINYLLDLMITRSDNSAANCLIDVAGRPDINTLIHKNGWDGSEVTRKFLKRKYEDPGYEKIRGTMTSSLHAADFMYKVYTNSLVNPWVSMQMKCLLGRQRDKSKLASGLPANVMYYNKTGWFMYWTNDVGIADDGKTKYVISCFIPVESGKAIPLMKTLSARIYALMRQRNGMK
ncbi:MAG: class A beta-lactamase-related serine hydrolase [Bacteroidales bacterium]|jgi:beta-lactamase class A|nr:class A beta-lactamase-related serine hydrolase [Bacteroidales bacterium]